MNYSFIHTVLINLTYISMVFMFTFGFSALSGMAITGESKKFRIVLMCIFWLIAAFSALAVEFLPYLLPEYQIYLDTLEASKQCFHCR